MHDNFLFFNKTILNLNNNFLQTIMNSSIRIQEGFKKKIGEYVISYCPSQYLGKSLHGQMRAGYHQTDNKIFIFRINPLPLTPSMINFLNLQKSYSQLKEYSRMTYGDLNSSSYNYTILQYFPKTFQTQINNFRKTSKYFDQLVQKFLKTYSFFYNMKVSHGNLIPSNIGITFDNKVKLMDFQCVPQEGNQQNFQKDFHNFKAFISRVLEKDSNFPYKFSSFNTNENSKWEHLFSLWHVTSPLQPVYLQRKNYIQNIVTTLYKLQSSLSQIQDKFEQNSQLQQQESQLKSQKQQISSKNQANEQQNYSQTQKLQSFSLSPTQRLNQFKMSIRLLQYNYLCKAKETRLVKQKKAIQQILTQSQTYNLSQIDFDYFNSVIIGAIQDFQYYNIDPSRRLLFLSCLITELNHQYIYNQIVYQFKNNQYQARNLLLGDSLYSKYKQTVFRNLLKQPKQKPIF